jgi:hypothetical protein
MVMKIFHIIPTSSFITYLSKLCISDFANASKSLSKKNDKINHIDLKLYHGNLRN